MKTRLIIVIITLATVFYGLSEIISLVIKQQKSAHSEWERQRERHWTTLYQGWCNLYDKTNVTYQQWAALYNSGLLPKPGENHAGTGAGEIAAGVIAGRMIDRQLNPK